jgi:hypothetical protein
VDCSSYNRSHRSKFWRGNLAVGDPLKIDWVEPEEIRGISYFPKVAVEYRVNDGKEEKENWTDVCGALSEGRTLLLQIVEAALMFWSFRPSSSPLVRKIADR